MPKKRKEYRDVEPTLAEKKKITNTLRQYLDREVKLREDIVREKKAIVTGVTEHLRECIPHTSDVFHCGSAYENLATNANHDYDVMFDVVPKGSQFQVEEVQPGFSKLKYMSGASAEYRKSYVTEDGYLSRDKVMDKQVKSSIDKMLSKCDHKLEVDGKEVRIKRAQHGPAVTLNLEAGRYKFPIDVVVSVAGCRVQQEDKGIDYVAKAPDKQNLRENPDTWRMSYSRKEREAFKGCDQGNQCHKEVLRVVKHMRGNHPTLQTLPSYNYKNILLNMMEKEKENSKHGSVVKEWSPEQIGDRFRDFTKELYFSLDKHEIPVRFNNDINLLSSVSRRSTNGLRGCMRSNIAGGGAGMMKMMSY